MKMKLPTIVIFVLLLLTTYIQCKPLPFFDDSSSSGVSMFSRHGKPVPKQQQQQKPPVSKQQPQPQPQQIKTPVPKQQPQQQQQQQQQQQPQPQPQQIKTPRRSLQGKSRFASLICCLQNNSCCTG